MSTGKDYYKILGVSRDADQDAIKKAYRKSALQWHPDKHPEESRPEAAAKFKDIAEAWDVLSDPQKKHIYDNPAGPSGSSDRNDHSNPFGAGYEFTGDPEDMFAQFFKNSFKRSSSFGMGAPNDDDFGVFSSMGMSASLAGMRGMKGGGGASKSEGGRGQTRPATVDLCCSLEELYNGSVRKMKVRRTSTTIQREAEVVLEVNVKPGWKAGTKVTFPGEGDELGTSGQAQDLAFVIREKQHPLYTREGPNLLHHRKIPLVDALAGGEPIKLQHLEKDQNGSKVLSIKVNDMVTPTYTKVCKGKGMPSSRKPDEKGDLVITFDIMYPKKGISEDAKREIRRLIPSA